MAFLRIRKAKVGLVLTVLTAILARGQTPAVDEYRVKAAFLFNFAKFVEWPASAFKSADEPISICVFGRNPFGSALEDAVRGKTIGARRLVVRDVSNVQQAIPCHILFAASGAPQQLRQLLEDLRGVSVLTVGDTDAFIANGGVINFRLEAGRVRFEIAVNAATRARLRISSKLLNLADTPKR